MLALTLFKATALAWAAATSTLPGVFSTSPCKKKAKLEDCLHSESQCFTRTVLHVIFQFFPFFVQGGSISEFGFEKCHRSWQLIRARQSKSGHVANCCKLQVKTITTPTKSVVIAAERKYNFKIFCIQNLTISLAPYRILMHFSAFPHLCSARRTG